jgi:outer membrane biosynthesis protein TonB
MAVKAVKQQTAKKVTTKTTRTSTKTKRKTTKTKTPKQVLELVKRAEAQQAEEKKQRAKTKKSASSKNSKQPKRKQAKPKKSSVKKSSTVSKQSQSNTIRVEYVPDTEDRFKFKGFASTETKGQINYEDMIALSVTKRHTLWKKLNASAHENQFFPILTKDARRQLKPISFDEAVARELIKEKKPVKDALYCPYCVSWSRFRQFSYTGYHKCTGCGISTEDYYVKLANHMFKR